MKLLVCAVILVCIYNADALRCYQCREMDNSEHKEGAVQKVKEAFGDLTHNCKTMANTLFGEKGKTVECPSGNYQCGFVSGSISLNLVVKKIQSKFYLRDCFPVTSQSTGCMSLDKTLKKGLSGLLKLDSPLGDIDGEACFCGSDLCANCGADSVAISRFCVPWWFIGVVIGGVLLLVSFVVCCCCCCCCRKSSRGRIVMQPAPGQAQYAPLQNSPHLMMTAPAATAGNISSGGVNARENPVYGQHAATTPKY